MCLDWDLPRLEIFNRYWAKHPPAHVCLAVLAQERRLVLKDEDDGAASNNLAELLASIPKSPRPKPTGRMVRNDGTPIDAKD